jgi:hypothetical protein
MELPIVHQTMVEAFQCPGCVAGMNIKCGAFDLEVDGGMFRCNGHCAGTVFAGPMGATTIVLGLPRGFHRLGPQAHSKTPKMRLWVKGSRPDWDKYNVPVWAMEKDGFLFVRTFMPRNNYPMIDVIEGGTLDMCPGAINVGEFYEEIE